MELLKVAMSNKTAFVSMCSRDSAIWFSFIGLYHAFAKYGVEADFIFPSEKPSQEELYNSDLFYYKFSNPFETAKSIYKLSKKLNQNYSKVVVFSQGVFPAILTGLLNNNIEVIAWVHEVGDYCSRTGFFRGINYYLSDKYMQTQVGQVVVSSHEMMSRVSTMYKNKPATFAYLPLSGDFSCLLEDETILIDHSRDDNHRSLNLVFFGGVTSYKGLDVLQWVMDNFEDGDIQLIILGRGDLSAVAPKLYQRFKDNRNVQWINTFLDAEAVSRHLLSSDLLYLYYNSVTATSLVDISNAFGLPVLCSRLPYFEQRVEHNVNGLILDMADLVPTIGRFVSGEFEMNKNQVREHFLKFGATRECVDSLVASGIV
jgi:glycosyltransferase involved in cell wall biosynthesis